MKPSEKQNLLDKINKLLEEYEIILNDIPQDFYEAEFSDDDLDTLEDFQDIFNYVVDRLNNAY